MKIMILSDSHSMKKEKLLQLLNSVDADVYLHCGDIYLPYTPLEFNHFYNVRGNNDSYSIPEDFTDTFDGLKFYVTHGHYFDVSYNYDELEEYANEHSINVVCFGHTHRPTLFRHDNTLFINPGSVSYPRGDYPHPTYCIFDTQSQDVIFYDVKTQNICNPFKQKEKKSFFDFFKRKKR